jgi:hypothetical protein
MGIRTCQYLPIYRLNDQLYTNIQNTKTQPMYPQHNIYTNKCMDICIPSCECRPFPMPPSAKINLVHIMKHRSMDLVLNKQGKINRSGGITMCQSDRSRRKEQ